MIDWLTADYIWIPVAATVVTGLITLADMTGRRPDHGAKVILFVITGGVWFWWGLA